MKTVEMKEAALKNTWPKQTTTATSVVKTRPKLQDKNKINYSDLKKEIATPTSGGCKTEDVQKYHSNK